MTWARSEMSEGGLDPQPSDPQMCRLQASSHADARLVRTSSRSSPHGRHDRAAAGVLELTVRLEAHAGVPAIIGGI